MAEWLRRWTRNPLGSPRAGSNPADYEPFCSFPARAGRFLSLARFAPGPPDIRQGGRSSPGKGGGTSSRGHGAARRGARRAGDQQVPGRAGAARGRTGERKERSAGRRRLREGKELRGSRVLLRGFAPGHLRYSRVFLHFTAGADPWPVSAPFPPAITSARLPSTLAHPACYRPPGTSFPCGFFSVGSEGTRIYPGACSGPLEARCPQCFGCFPFPCRACTPLPAPAPAGSPAMGKRSSSPFPPSRSCARCAAGALFAVALNF